MAINLKKIGVEFSPPPFRYNPQTVELYHLGIGATELEYVYEKNLQVIPSFAVVPAFGILLESIKVAGVNPMMIVHGEQRIELAMRPIPWQADTVTVGRIAHIYDKGKGALLIVEAETKNQNGDLMFRNIYSLFARGEGGFGGERGPGAKNAAPERKPDHVVELQTGADQHKIYRLSGDLNPLHIDPDFAKLAGYPRPILHGLCTFGYVCRAVLQAVCDNRVARIKSWEARFSGEVYPGDKIIAEIWRDGEHRALVQAKTGDGRVVLSNGAAELA